MQVPRFNIAKLQTWQMQILSVYIRVFCSA